MCQSLAEWRGDYLLPSEKYSRMFVQGICDCGSYGSEVFGSKEQRTKAPLARGSLNYGPECSVPVWSQASVQRICLLLIMVLYGEGSKPRL